MRARLSAVRSSFLGCFCSCLLACVASGMPPVSPRSPASPRAQSAPARAIATSLHEDPLAPSPTPPTLPNGHEHEHEHHHSTAASAADGGSEPAPAVYTCPMHPEVRERNPGNCPKCGMHLVLSKPQPDSESAHDHAH